jgi:Ca-activated chloride channel homolog
MSFLWLDALWLLLLLPVFVFGYILLLRRRKKYAVRYSNISLVKDALGHRPGIRRYIPPALLLLCIAVMIIALARPAATIVLPSERGTIILAIDVSGSMRASDIKPSRLEAAKSAARVFVEKQPAGVRLGVVCFSGTTAITQAPTTDREAVLAAIDRLYTQFRTAIGSGILTSLDAIFEKPGNKPAPVSSDILQSDQQKLSTSPVPSGTYAPAIILLLSDGQSNTGPPPLTIIDQAISRGVRIYTVGMGTASGVIQGYDSNYSIRVSLDETTLTQIAKLTGGKYYKANDESELYRIYEDLGTQLVFEQKQTELTALVTGLAVVIALIAAILSLLWFNRFP